MRQSAVLVLFLLLAGCVDGSGRWTKPDAAEEQISRDFAECRSEARAATRRDAGIDADILATRGGDWQRLGTLTLHRDEMAASERSNGDAILARCMSAKGYARKG
jgi:hypothetical protein